MTQCTAKSKRTHERCKAQAITGRAVCRHHGGKSPQGIASATLKTGKYSNHLPTRMLAAYEASQNDPELLGLSEEVHVVDARLVELLANVDSGESLAAWNAIWDGIMAMERANARKDPDGAREAWQTIKSTAARGRGSAQAWIEFRGWQDHRRKLVESEQKRRTAMQDMVSSEQAMLFVGALVQAVRDHVSDPATLAAISDDLARIAPNVAMGRHRTVPTDAD